MSKRRKNAGEGYGFMFSGAFSEKKDAVKKEKQRKGSFIKGMPTRHGYRYVVMTPRTNPRKIHNRTNYESGYFSERHGDGSLGIVIWANTQAGPFHVQPYVNNWDTATHQVGKYKTLAMARKKAHAYLEREGRYKRGNPSELLVMGANPSEYKSREIQVNPGDTINIRVNPEPNPLGFHPGLLTGKQQRARYGRTPYNRKAAAMLRRARKHKYDFAEDFGKDIQRRGLTTPERNPICGARIGGEVCTRKPGHRGPHLPQGATMRTRSRLPQGWQPNPSAEALRERFTGASVDKVKVYDEPHMPAGDYAMLGKMLSLYVKPHAGGQVQEIKLHGVIAVSDESARQIYFVGGDQDVSSGLGVFGAVERERGVYELGEARRIDYKQRKEHVPHPESDSWRHDFGEETGVRPLVLYDARAKRLLLEGGQYVIRAEGIVN